MVQAHKMWSLPVVDPQNVRDDLPKPIIANPFLFQECYDVVIGIAYSCQNQE
ncbi:hypothetical protein [Aestuariivita boseongensis]|uniref:hypothetical protein n=1 Tax=Aestuariivita boseongensis TaxID=1470562 RepID=UPI00155DB564|nr:hypothetical protein [Aestuariivita boseongensis]